MSNLIHHANNPLTIDLKVNMPFEPTKNLSIYFKHFGDAI